MLQLLSGIPIINFSVLSLSPIFVLPSFRPGFPFSTCIHSPWKGERTRLGFRHFFSSPSLLIFSYSLQLAAAGGGSKCGSTQPTSCYPTFDVKVLSICHPAVHFYLFFLSLHDYSSAPFSLYLSRSAIFNSLVSSDVRLNYLFSFS